MLWPLIYELGCEISFAHQSFRWSNLASHNAGVTVVVVGVRHGTQSQAVLFESIEKGPKQTRIVNSINPYLVPGPPTAIVSSRKPIGGGAIMLKGNQPSDGGSLCLSRDESDRIVDQFPSAARFIKGYFGSADFIRGLERYCLWIDDGELSEAQSIPPIAARLSAVAEIRSTAKAPTTRPAADWPHRFIQIQSVAARHSIIVPRVSSERREYLPVGLLSADAIISDSALAIYDAPLWNLSLIASRIHLVWIATVCGKLKTDFRYSNTLGWNTFPVPKLTETDKANLTRCAEDILLAREAHYPATIAELYDPEKMPDDLRAVHARNDETLERIYIGRRFRNDTERLEKLFEMYTRMTTKVSA